MAIFVFSNLDWGNWAYGMWVAVIGGASNGVIAGLGLTLIDPKTFNTSTAAFRKMVIGLFVVSAVKDFFLYLAQNPAPKEVTKTTTFVTSVDTQGATIRMKETIEKTAPVLEIKPLEIKPEVAK